MLRPHTVQMRPATWGEEDANYLVRGRQARMDKYLTLPAETAERVRKLLIEVMMVGEAPLHRLNTFDMASTRVAIERGLIRVSLASRSARVTELGKRFLEHEPTGGGGE